MTQLSFVGAHADSPWQTYLSQVDRVLPYLGRLPGHEHAYVAACARGGFTLGPLFGQLMAQLIVDGQPSIAIDSFNPGRFGNG